MDRSYFACSDTEDDSIGIDNEGSSVASSDVVAKSLNTTGVGPCGASGVIHGKSSYQVPSEMARNEVTMLFVLSASKLTRTRIFYHSIVNR